MLFNSYAYIFLFLPLTLILYFVLNKRRLTKASKVWLVITSLVFYCWWNPIYLPLIAGSIIFNYVFGTHIARQREQRNSSRAKRLLIVGIVGNLGLLGYFKYTDFFIGNFNSVANQALPLLHIVLPLGISFFTFTQIAYLVDAEKGKAKEYSALNYGLFVTFFPHLLAGPILHHREMMPQFDRQRNKVVDYENISRGVCLFFVGLFKKVVIADTFALWANNGFDNPGSLTLIPAWITSLSYAMQIYYDFSGYTDMALGSSQIFNIRLPINFNSPYRSTDIQEFWRRWHITLGRFFKDYIYIPLGGNRISSGRTLLNLLITFFLVGLWHGAGWTFVIWGLLHGVALIVHRLWKNLGISMPKWLAWFLTFNFVNAVWIFFRAKNFDNAIEVFRGMTGLHGVALPVNMQAFPKALGYSHLVTGDILGNLGNANTICGMFLVFLPLSVLFRNSNEMAYAFKPDLPQLIFLSLIAALSVLFLGTYSEFLYFRF